MGLTAAISAGRPSVDAATLGVRVGMLAQMAGLSTALVGTGASLMDGLAAGIRLRASAVALEAAAAVKGAVIAAKVAGQIHSPSRLMRDQVGVQLAQGVAEGINKGRANVNRAMESLITVPSLAGGASGANGYGVTNNITMPLLPGESPQEQRDNLVKVLKHV